MPPRVRIGRSVYLALPASDVVPRPRHRAEARSLVRRLVGPDIRRLREYLQHEGLLGLRDDLEDPIEVAAELLCHGTCTWVHLTEAARRLDEPTITDLVDPRHPIVDPLDPRPARPPRVDPTPPDAPDPSQPDPTRPDPTGPRPPSPDANTRTSFQVVDTRGRPLLGTFRCALDGRTESGDLDRKVHKMFSVTSDGTTALALHALTLPRADDGVHD